VTRRGKQPGGGRGKGKGAKDPNLVVDDKGHVLEQSVGLTDEQKARKLERALRLQDEIDRARMVESEAKRQLKDAKAATQAAEKKLQDHLHGMPEQGETFPAAAEDVDRARGPRSWADRDDPAEPLEESDAGDGAEPGEDGDDEGDS